MTDTPIVGLLPCPFCGGEQITFRFDDSEFDAAAWACSECDASGPIVSLEWVGGNREKASAYAAAQWNQRSDLTRTPSPSPCSLGEDVVEALEWYAEQVAGCRKLGRIGEPARHALDEDGGKRARAALSALRPVEGVVPLAAWSALVDAAEAYADFVAAREAMNAARPDIGATPAERALYDERYEADHQAEREHFRAAMRLSQVASDILTALSAMRPVQEGEGQ